MISHRTEVRIRAPLRILLRVDTQALERAILQFPVLLAAVRRYGVASPMTQQCIETQCPRIIREYRKLTVDLR